MALSSNPPAPFGAIWLPGSVWSHSTRNSRLHAPVTRFDQAVAFSNEIAR